MSFYYLHGRDKGHWTNECPIAKKSKDEMEKEASKPPKSINHTSGGGGRGGQACGFDGPSLVVQLPYLLLQSHPICSSVPITASSTFALPSDSVINTIYGGSNEPVHEMKRKSKDYLRIVNHVCE